MILGRIRLGWRGLLSQNHLFDEGRRRGKGDEEAGRGGGRAVGSERREEAEREKEAEGKELVGDLEDVGGVEKRERG